MANNGTLRYYKQYIVLNDSNTVEAIYADLHPIHNPDPTHLDCELYAVKEEKTELWGIIDKNGEYITPAMFCWISNFITMNQDEQSIQYTISVQYENEKYNLVTTAGKLLFTQGYVNIDNSDPDSMVCILRNGPRYGLGDVRTGEVILEPWYRNIERLKNDELFQVSDDRGKGNGTVWGLVDEDGKTLCEPQYVNYIPLGEWNDYNLAVGESSDDGLTHYTIIDWNGKKVYETDAKSCEKYLRTGSYTEYAINAYILVDKEETNKRRVRGSGRLLIIHYNSDNDRDEIYEIEFKFGRRDSANEIQRICYKLARHYNLADKIYYKL